MSQRRELEARITLYEELNGILGAMRSFALAELRRVSHRETAQRQLVQALEIALNDVSNSVMRHEPAEATCCEIWLLFGSVRGFCGSFNEDIMHFWRSQSGAEDALILVGERLHDLAQTPQNTERLRGAHGGLDATNTIDDILAAIKRASSDMQRPFHLTACVYDELGPRRQAVWPIPPSPSSRKTNPPLTLSPAAEVAVNVAEHYLYHRLLALLLCSIRIENHMRLIQMETALRHLEHGCENLERQRNRLRQEEIVEEIELMITSRRT
ncbi:MAG: hypothetical protein RL563_2763 [Pseudomonadota bacterium]